MSRSMMAAQATAVGVSLAIGLSYLMQGAAFDPHRFAADMDAYWDAGNRIREGLPLYASVADADASNVFRYPAWFALAWVPITFAPRDLVAGVWVGGMLLASGVALAPAFLARSVAGLVLGLLMAPVLVDGAWLGNVQPVLVCALVLGLGTRWEASAIAMAAATKLTLVPFVAVPLARRDLMGAAVASAIVAVLLIPNLFFDNSTYPVAIGGTLSLWVFGPDWWALGLAVGVGWLAWAVWRRSRFVALAAAMVSLSGPPRINLLNVPQLLAAAAKRRRQLVR